MQSNSMLTPQPYQGPTDQEIEQCCMLLRLTYQSTNDQERAKAEETLKLGVKDSKKFLQLLLAIAISQNPNIEEQTKNAAANYTNNVIKHQTIKENVSQEQRLFEIKMVFQAMNFDHLRLNLRLILGVTLTNLLTMRLSDNDDDAQLLLLEGIHESFAAASLRSVSGLIALQCLTNVSMLGNTIITIFEKTVKSLAVLAEKWIDPLLLELQALSVTLNDKTPEQVDQIILNLLDRIDALRVWAETIRNFVVKIGERKNDLLKHVVVYDEIPVILVKLLCLHIQSPRQLSDCVISTCGIKKFDDLINETKIKVMKILNKMVLFMYLRTDSLPLITTTKFFTLTQSIMLISIKSILTFCKSETIELSSALSQPGFECLLAEILLFLTNLAAQKDNYNIFSEHKRDLIVHVIFPLIRTTEGENELLRDNPSQFVHLAVDTCEKQKSQTVKTQTAQFMEILCERIDGALSYLTITALGLIEFSLESDKIEEIPTKFEILKDCNPSLILNKTPAIVRVETSLMILSVLSYTIPERDDLIELLEKLIARYKTFFYNTKDRNLTDFHSQILTIFLAIYHSSDQMPLRPDEFAALTIYLIQAIGLTGKNESAISLQAIDSLKGIVDGEDVVANRLTPYVKDVLEKLSEFIVFIQHPELFDVVQEYIKVYTTDLIKEARTVLLLVKALVIRIEKEIDRLMGSTEKTNIVINKCWNIIRTIGEEASFFPGLQKDLEDLLMPLFKYMEQPDLIEFDDDVLYLLNSMMQHTQTVSTVTWTLVQTFPKLFVKFKGVLGPIFQCINYIIVYGKEDFKKVPAVLDLIIGLACEALSTESKHASEANRSEGALIIHLLFQYHPTMIDSKQKQFIMKTVIDILKSGVRQSFYRARLFGVILHGFMADYAWMEAYLLSQNMLSDVIWQMLDKIDNFKLDYDKKVFVIGFCSVLIQERLQDEVQKHLPLIFDSVITMLKIIQAIELANIKRKAAQAFNTKKSIKQSYQERLYKKKASKKDEDDIPDDEEIAGQYLREFQDRPGHFKILKPSNPVIFFDKDLEDDELDDEDDDSDEDMPYLPENDEEEQKTAVDFLITDFKKKDEFAIFREIIFKIKEINHDGLAKIINKLPQGKQNYLKQVLQSERVPVDEENQTTRARKIVTIKGKKGISGFTQKGNEMSDN